MKGVKMMLRKTKTNIKLAIKNRRTNSMAVNNIHWRGHVHTQKRLQFLYKLIKNDITEHILRQPYL